MSVSPRGGAQTATDSLRCERVTLAFPFENDNMNSYLAKSSVVAALGGLLFGFDTAVIAGAISALQLQYSLTDAQR